MINRILKEYTKSKRTALLAHDKAFNKWYHIFSVIELLPTEIEEYKIPNNKWHKDKKHPLTKSIRSNIDSEIYTFYLVIQDLSTEQAMLCFNSPFQNNIIDNQTNDFINKSFVKEPSGNSPYVLSSNIYNKSGLSSILPKRHSGLYVWSQIDSERHVENLFKIEPKSYEMKSMSQLTNDWLGFAIWDQPEHIGNIYLVASNPYYRDLDYSLSQNPNGIFYKLKLRQNIIPNFTVRIIDTHGDYIALDKDFKIDKNVGLIQLPHEPHLTELRIYNIEGDLIGKTEPAAFIKSFQIDMSIKQTELHIKKDEKTEAVIEKFSGNVLNEKLNPSDFNSQYYFTSAENKRQHVINRENKDFVFFRAANGDQNEMDRIKDEAKNIIRELINKANYRCYICDPYFNSTDLINYAYYIKNINTELKILNSTIGINKSIAKDLLENIKDYNEKPFQKIELRVLFSNVLHDRFIVADNEVWYIGSSLNQIGSKSSCIAKVPKSDDTEIIKEIEKWFLNKEQKKYSQTLQEYVDNITE